MVTQEKPAVSIEDLRIVQSLNRAQDIEIFIEAELRKGMLANVSSVAQARILNIVDLQPDITPGEIAAKMHQRAHSVSGLLNRLEDNDLIIRVRDRTDRRVVHVGLTPAGEACLEGIRDAMAKAEAHFS